MNKHNVHELGTLLRISNTNSYVVLRQLIHSYIA